MAFPIAMRKEAGKRRGWKCEICGRKFTNGFLMECHHRIATSRGGEDTLENLQILCMFCHYNMHKDMATKGLCHPASASIIKRRLEKTKGRTKEWLDNN